MRDPLAAEKKVKKKWGGGCFLTVRSYLRPPFGQKVTLLRKQGVALQEGKKTRKRPQVTAGLLSPTGMRRRGPGRFCYGRGG